MDRILAREVTRFHEALSYSGAVRYLQGHHRLMKIFRAAGVVMVDSLPRQLHVQLLNEYLRMKRGGLI